MKECEYPNVKAVTGYRYGCRCERCGVGKKREKKYKPKTKRKRTLKPYNMPSLYPDLVRKSERPTATAFGGC